MKFLHIFAFLYTERNRNTHLQYLSVCLSICLSSLRSRTCFCALFSWENERTVCNETFSFVCIHAYTCLYTFSLYIHAWDGYGLLGTWNSHGLFGNKITAAQNLLKSSYRIMTLFCLIFIGIWSSSCQFGNWCRPTWDKVVMTHKCCDLISRKGFKCYLCSFCPALKWLETLLSYLTIHTRWWREASLLGSLSSLGLPTTKECWP